MEIKIFFSKFKEKTLELASKIYSDFDFYWFKFWLNKTKLVEAYLNNEIVGFCQVFITNTFCGKSGIIMYLGVKENLRRKGIGTKIVKWIEEYFKMKSCDVIISTTRIENFSSIRFFYKLGYKPFYLDCIERRIEEGFELIRKLQAYEDDILFIKKISKKDNKLLNLEECFAYEII